MIFTAKELAISALALRSQVGQNGLQPRFFALEKLKLSMDLLEKILKFVDPTGKEFLDGEFEITTSEKGLLIELLTRPWTVDDGRVVLDLKDKLEK